MLHVKNTKHTIYVGNQKYKKGFRRKSNWLFKICRPIVEFDINYDSMITMQRRCNCHVHLLSHNYWSCQINSINLNVYSKLQIYRGYLLFWGEYQIYFIECVENIRIFTSAQHEWKFRCFQLTRWNTFGIYRKQVNFLFIIYFLGDIRLIE